MTQHLTPKMRNVLSQFIKYNKPIKKTLYGSSPLLKAINDLNIDDLYKIQQFKFFDAEGKMKMYPSEFTDIYKKLDRNMDDPEDTRYIHSGGSMHFTLISLQIIFKDIDLDMFK